MDWLKRMIGMADKPAKTTVPSSADVMVEEPEDGRVATQAIEGLIADLDSWFAMKFGDARKSYMRTFKQRIDGAFVKADDPDVSLKDTLRFEWEGLKAHVENKFGEITDEAIASFPSQWREDFFERLGMMEEFRSAVRVHLNNKKEVVLNACYDLLDEIDHDEQARLKAQRRRDREAKDDAETILLRQMMDHSGWMEIFKAMHSYDVISLGMKAMETSCPAAVDIHFWNSVIDHSITAGYLDPTMNDQQREGTLGMAETFQNWVRARWAKKPETVEACEKAWASSAEVKQYQEHRAIMFEAGLVNQFGQLTGKSLD
jgi:hypothetical protein